MKRSRADKASIHLSCSKKYQNQLLSEQQEIDAIIQPLLDTENVFIKDLEIFLTHQDMLALRKRELLHKHWTQRVWQPVQNRIDRHLTHLQHNTAASLRTKYAQYLNYCNTKGYAFLDLYDPHEYDPLSQHNRTPRRYKVSTPKLKDPPLRQSQTKMNGNAEHAGMKCRETAKKKGREGRESQKSSRNTMMQYTAAEGRCFKPKCWSSNCRQVIPIAL